MTHHTPEPWAFSDTDHKDKDGVKSRFCELVNQTANFAHFRLFEVQNEEESKAVAILGCGPASYDNARRIVACINACAGISTENLEQDQGLKEELYQCQKDRQREHDLRSHLAGEVEELKRINGLLLQDAYSVYVEACESAGQEPESMDVWRPKFMRVIDRKAKTKEGA